ncbi:MAG: RNA polymerase sigma factor RpoD/SigA [Chitinispirillales bacterium]|nr:RNA polymerase sigma factor RpoD/SigA [Chitinispirillales bacterium]
MSGSEKYSISTDEESLKLYLKDITKYNPLTPDQEKETAREIRTGDRSAEERLIKANLRFVVGVAIGYQNQGLALSDLINEGNLGLIRAARRFDETKGFKFISYAVWWIRQAILQGLADHSRIVKVPLNRVATIYEVSKTREQLMQKYSRNPTNAEIAEAMGMSENDVINSMKISGRHRSLDAPLRDDGGILLDTIVNESIEDTDERALENSNSSEMCKIMRDFLTEREYLVVCKYYGIGEETHYTLEEIGQQMDITRERVRQLKDGALIKLRRSQKAQKLIRNIMIY